MITQLSMVDRGNIVATYTTPSDFICLLFYSSFLSNQHHIKREREYYMIPDRWDLEKIRYACFFAWTLNQLQECGLSNTP